MKTKAKTRKIFSTESEGVFLIGFIIIVLLGLALTSCNDDNEVSPDVAPILGTYSVVDTYEDGEVKNYTIDITKAKGGVEISNFGKIMYVPVKANFQNNAMSIPSQTFKGKSMTIVITGQGTLNGKQLTFDYKIDTGDDDILEHTCVATKN